jgi:hypothetical protein
MQFISWRTPGYISLEGLFEFLLSHPGYLPHISLPTRFPTQISYQLEGLPEGEVTGGYPRPCLSQPAFKVSQTRQLTYLLDLQTAPTEQTMCKGDWLPGRWRAAEIQPKYTHTIIPTNTTKIRKMPANLPKKPLQQPTVEGSLPLWPNVLKRYYAHFHHISQV